MDEYYSIAPHSVATLGTGVYGTWRNRVGAYQDIADISAYNQSRR